MKRGMEGSERETEGGKGVREERELNETHFITAHHWKGHGPPARISEMKNSRRREGEGVGWDEG